MRPKVPAPAGNSKRIFPSPVLTQKDKVHHKLKSEYNAFMNKIQSFETSVNHDMTVPTDAETKLPSSQFQKINPLELDSGLDRNDAIERERVFPMKKEESKKLPEQLLQDIPELQTDGLGTSVHSVHSVHSLHIFPKDDSNNFEQSSEHIPLSKKDVLVWNDGIQMSYKSFRQGPTSEDGIIFVLPPVDIQNGIPEDIESSYMFIGYSKKQLYEEYMIVGHDTFFILNVIEEESYYIPMHQIVRILEYSHPMYLLEKMQSLHIQDDSYVCFAKPAKF
jgi:hypothetical protein